jgi:hypothetical protein
MRKAEDPFREHEPARLRARLHVMGGVFTVESGDAELLDLAVEAFGGMPKHRLERKSHHFTVQLVRTSHKKAWRNGAAPPPPVLSAGAGLLCAAVDAGTFAVVDVPMSRALICISNAMLRHRYHARYELVELVFLTLAARAQSLVPLHAACVGANGRGLLLMGGSGTGKSTLSLHALSGGMQLLSEDSAFVALEGLRATGVSNYLHVTPQALRYLKSKSLRRAVERSPLIERRSGARKLEFDLRDLKNGIVRAPLRLAATVFLSRRPAGRQPALRPLDRETLVARLRREQPYASARPNWSTFEQRIADLPAYELRRTEHPDAAVRQLQLLL